MSDSSHTSYVAIWAVLVVALVVSLALPSLMEGRVMVTVIFVIAGVKAFLVLNHFMHIKVEPKLIRWLVIGSLAALVALFGGLYTDVVVATTIIEAP